MKRWLVLFGVVIVSVTLLYAKSDQRAIGVGSPIFGDGSDGSITFSANQTITPPADAVVDAGSSGSTMLTVSGLTGTFGSGDVVLIHQTRGSAAGSWELNEVSSYSLGNIFTASQLVNSYSTVGSNAAQVLVIPEYSAVTVNSGVTISAKDWNGSTGGILALLVSDSLTVDGTVSATGAGYRGGSAGVDGASFQGEGHVGLGSQGPSGPNGNGGGAAQQLPPLAGGGGGHGTTGSPSTEGSSSSSGGLVAGTADLSTAVLGGGGGGSSGSGWACGGGRAGGDGGGFAFIQASNVALGTSGAIRANGVAGNSDGEHGSGGGAGGAVLVRFLAGVFGQGTVEALGGAGGLDHGCTGTSSEDGGAGGLGRIRVEYCGDPPSGGTANPPASIAEVSCVVGGDTDGDGCSDKFEQQTEVGTETSGGRRDYLNGNDYFNPTHDGENRIDDIVAVLNQYFDDDDDANPGLPPYAPGYNPDTDRTLVGPNLWNLGPPNGLQRVDDIVNALNHYFHDCS